MLLALRLSCRTKQFTQHEHGQQRSSLEVQSLHGEQALDQAK